MNHNAIFRTALSVLLMIYAAVSAAEDIRYREISLRLSVVFTLLGLMLSLIAGRSITDIITALIPGMMIWLMSVLTRGAIGIGDAVYTAACAAYLSVRELGLCVACAWLFCALTALVVIARTLITVPRGRDLRRGLPFAAYMLPPILCAAVNKLM